MDLRVWLLLSVVALESAITGARILHDPQAENVQPIIYTTDASNSGHRKFHTMQKKFNDLSHDEFQAVDHLKALIISNQTISGAWLNAKDYLFASETVEFLFLMNNKLKWVPTNAWARMPNLKFLSLADNILRDVNLKSLKQLVALDVAKNLFSNDSTNFLTQLNTLTRLRTLNLTNNYITSLSNIKSSSLVTLDVSGNAIHSIEENDLVNLPTLMILYIRQNKLKRIHPLAFVKLNYLTGLDLSNNVNLMRLPIFKMFKCHEKDCGLFYFDCSNCGIEKISPETFNDMPNLVYLHLTRNNLKILPNRFFVNLTSLQSLDLAENSIRWIPNGMFEGAKSLDFLNLEGNPLRTLSLAPFLKTPRLSTLNVARCGLTHLWDTTNGVLESLKYLNAANNSIKVITEREVAVTPNIQELDLSGNPAIADAKRIAHMENQNIKLTTTVLYTESRLGIKGIEKRPEQNSNESPSEDYYQILFVKQTLLKIITVADKAALDGIVKAQLEFAKRQQHILIMMGVVTGLVIFSGLIWCLTRCSKKTMQMSIPRNLLLKPKESSNIKYQPLEEESVRTISKLELKLTE